MADGDHFLKLSESELTSLLDQKKSNNTKKASKVALNVFRDYLKERKIGKDSLVALKDKLKTVLRKFYAKVSKKNSLLFPPKNWKQSRWSHGKTIIIIELSCCKISWLIFVSDLQINYLPQPWALADNDLLATDEIITIFCSTLSNNCLLIDIILSLSFCRLFLKCCLGNINVSLHNKKWVFHTMIFFCPGYECFLLGCFWLFHFVHLILNKSFFI